MQAAANEVRWAVRSLARDFRVTIPAVLTLVLGIGLNSAIFSGVKAMLFDALPFDRAGELVEVSSRRLPGQERLGVSHPDFEDLAARARSWSALGALRRTRLVVGSGGESEVLPGALVTPGLLPMLGASPELGRGFAAGEERAGGAPAILSHAFWQRRFGADPRVLGRAVSIDGSPAVVIGVMPEGFEFPPDAAVWLPLPPDDDRAQRSLTVLGRLRPGVSLEVAAGELETVFRGLAEQHPASNEDVGAAAVPLREALIGKYRAALVLLQTSVLFVLAIACANVASLLLARGVARREELVIRSALGADRLGLTRLLLIESLVLALVGGAGGLFAAFLAVRRLAARLPRRLPGVDAIAVDQQVLLFTLALALLTGLLFGLVPVVQAWTTDLRQGMSHRHGSGPRRMTVQRLMMVGEVALVVMLLSGSTLLIRSFLALQRVDPGIRAEGVETMAVTLPAHRFGEAEAEAALGRVRLRLRELPGIEAVGAVRIRPFTGWNPTAVLELDDAAGEAAEGVVVDTQPVQPGYFEAMGIPLLAGARLTDADAEGPPRVALVNDVLRRRHFPRGEALGKRLRLVQDDSSTPWLTVVGVVGDVPQHGLHLPPRPEVYYPAAQRSMTLVVRRAPGVRLQAQELERQVLAAAPGAVVGAPLGMPAVLHDVLFTRRLLAGLMGALAALALLLAAVGLYGLVSYWVAQRRREMGVRLALGAAPRRLQVHVLGGVLPTVTSGLVLGLVGSLALARLLASLLFEVSVLEPATFLTVVAVLGAVALAASLGPARQAARVDPATVLRDS